MGGLQIFDKSLDPSKALTNQFDQGSLFTQFLIFEFFPQRAFLFGICLVLWVLGSLCSAPSRKTKWIAALGLGLLPLLHLHSFLAISIPLLALFAFPLSGSGTFSDRKSALSFGSLVAGIGGASQLFLFHEKNPNSLSWNIILPGWAQNPSSGQAAAIAMNPIWFWIYNTGLFLPAAFAGFWIIRKNRDFRAWAVTGFLLFCISLVFCMQPYFYDNLKLFTYAFLFLAFFLGIFLEWIQNHAGRFGRILAPLLLLLQCGTGIHELLAFQKGIEHATWFGPSELELAKGFKKIRNSPNDRVLINPIHNHPIPCLAGNPVVMGYPGWLWSWGIQYNSLESRIGSVLTGDSAALANVKALAPRYIVVNANEKFQNHPIAIPFLDSNFKKILSVDTWQVYQIEPSAR
jgi:hypothetical protein